MSGYLKCGRIAWCVVAFSHDESLVQIALNGRRTWYRIEADDTGRQWATVLGERLCVFAG